MLKCFLQNQWNQQRKFSFLVFCVCCRWTFLWQIFLIVQWNRNENSSFCILVKRINPKTRPWSQYQIQGRSVRASLALIGIFSICISQIVTHVWTFHEHTESKSIQCNCLPNIYALVQWNIFSLNWSQLKWPIGIGIAS